MIDPNGADAGTIARMKAELARARELFSTTTVDRDRADDLFRVRVVKAIREAQSRGELP